MPERRGAMADGVARAGDGRDGGAAGPTAAEVRAATEEARRELDRAWRRILAEQGARDPGRAAAIRALIETVPAPIRHGVGAGFVAARLAWPHLDHTARRAWLAALSAIWRRTLATPALHRAFARALVLGERDAAGR